MPTTQNNEPVPQGEPLTAGALTEQNISILRAQAETVARINREEVTRISAMMNGGVNVAQPTVTETDNRRQCYRCEDMHEPQDTAELDGHIYCDTCHNDITVTCECCENQVHQDNARQTSPDDYVCDDCANENYHACENCGEYLCNDENDSVCHTCRERRRRIDTRSPNTSTIAYIGNKAGKIVGVRPFGVEIECLLANHDSAVAVSNDLPREWGVGRDGSVSGVGEQVPVEIQTPILAGDIGERAILSGTKILRDKATTVNKTCGLHIHLAAHDIKQDKNSFNYIKKLFYFYVSFDEVITSMLPKARRGNRYAKILKNEFVADEILQAKTLENIEEIWYKTTDHKAINNAKGQHRDGETRYRGINLHVLLNYSGRSNTVEIRYHSPTISPTKILNWVALHQNILEHIPHTTIEQLKQGNRLLMFSDKLKAFHRLIKSSSSLVEYVNSRIKLFSSDLLTK